MFQFVIPKFLRYWHDTIWFGQSGKLIGRSKLNVVAGFSENFSDRDRVESPGICRPGATVLNDPNADALALGGDKMFDFPLIHANSGFATATDIGLDLLAAGGLGHHSISDRL